MLECDGLEPVTVWLAAIIGLQHAISPEHLVVEPKPPLLDQDEDRNRGDALANAAHPEKVRGGHPFASLPVCDAETLRVDCATSSSDGDGKSRDFVFVHEIGCEFRHSVA